MQLAINPRQTMIGSEGHGLLLRSKRGDRISVFDTPPTWGFLRDAGTVTLSAGRGECVLTADEARDLASALNRHALMIDAQYQAFGGCNAQ